MTTAASPAAPRRRDRGPSLAARIVLSPWLWGTVLTCVFYAAIPALPVGRELAQRYFTAHPTEYALMALSFLGLAILAIKGITSRGEWRAFREVKGFGIDSADTPFEARCAQLDQQVQRLNAGRPETYWSHRLGHLHSYLKNAGQTPQDADHINYLSEASADRLHGSYALLNTIIWAIPIIGFLGTVLGITMAIANLTPDKLESALNDVTRDLALAFDTTAIALTSSLFLGFMSLFVRRSEEALLTEIDERCRLEIQRYFPAESATATNPLLEAQQSAAMLLTEQTEHLLRQQTSQWQSTLDEARHRWHNVLEQQQSQLAASLGANTTAALDSHSEQLQQLRLEFVTAYSAVSEQLRAEMRELDQRQHETTTVLRLTLHQFSEQFQQGLSAQLGQQAAGMDQVITHLGERLERLQSTVESWQQRLDRLGLAHEQHALKLHAQTETLSTLVGQESELVRLQQHLSDNLQAVRAAEAFDETLHNLSAAVHMLTARARAA